MTAMDQSLIAIRAAKPTYDEGLLCGRYLNQAAEGFFHLMLGPHFAQVIAEAFKHPNHNYSFQNVYFVTYDGRIIGMVLGYTAFQSRRFSDQPIIKAAGYRNLRMRIVKLLFAPMLRVLETIADGDFYILAMAIDKKLRGKGLGTALMNSIVERACTNGSTRLSLDVSANNGRARHVYEKWGMRIESQWPKRLPLPGLKFYRMAKSI